ncbi:MAG TPA: EAL domain-containing protein, partial [Micromonosporaceae bacterium]|nr:EAL domain-containing protein [Micromonosporaceae bacterium]
AIAYEGPEAGAPPTTGTVVVADLDRRDPDDDIDVVTVRLPGSRRHRSPAETAAAGVSRQASGRASVAAPPGARITGASPVWASAEDVTTAWASSASGGVTNGSRTNGGSPNAGTTNGTASNGTASNGAKGSRRGGERSTSDAAAGVGSATATSPFGRPHGAVGRGVLGELRLRFRAAPQFGDREEYMLRALAAALGTAVRKSHAVAEAARIVMAGNHAFNHDPLTGLANRRHLLDFDALPDNGLAGLVVIDLTGLKDIVGGLGQTVGDQVIAAVAHRLAATVDPGDLVARVSRNEFAVLYPRLPAASTALERTRKLIAAVSEPLRIDEVRLTVGPLAGLAVAGDGTVEELLRRADVALSQAKQSNQSIAMYVPSWDTADVEQLALFADLPRAVANREFTTLFQPIVDLGTGAMIGAEALARWPHPELGQLPPGRFLSGIERSGLLSAFTEQILDRALAGACRWRDAGFPVPVAVNVSPRSLLDPSFPARIPAALARYHLPPDALVIEVTETFTLSQLEVVDDVLHTLHEMGVTLALDDFGTGYSSLAMVARVPVHELKIDRSFVTGLSGVIENAIVRSTIELGRTLKLLVVAEGVETDEQRRRLWDFGCPAGQGHLFGRPIDVGELVTRLQRGKDGVPGSLAAPLHRDGTVIRLPAPRTPPEQRAQDDRP